MQNLGLLILRAVFVMVAIGLGVGLINTNLLPKEPWAPWLAVAGLILVALTVVMLDVAIRRKELETVTAVYFGMIVGMFLTYVVRLALIPIIPNIDSSPLGQWLLLFIGMILCYLCISILMQTKDDFRFIIPYVEFSREIKGRRPLLLDTSAIIDGRIADALETAAFDSEVVIPVFVIDELQAIADSHDRGKRSRGRRGLDILARLRENKLLDLSIFARDLPEFADQPVDMRLVLLAKHLGGKLVTHDYNLNKVAGIHQVPVLNLNDLANALKPVFLVGETLEVRIVKAGEGPQQGVGYLEDGTMIIVEGARDQMQKLVRATVTSLLQKSAGRLVFAKYDGLVEAAV